ncbi:MAG: hypothetical protein IJH07_03500 [Ruminococcus sp.]|nr:hypothetical protein [Ruminococcus sp.]
MNSSNSVYSSLFIIIIYLLLLLPPLILEYIANWCILCKAGEKGWKALIPFYGKYIKFKLAWDKNVYWFLLIFQALSVVSYIMMRQPENLTDSPVWFILFVLTYLVGTVFTVFLQIHLAKAFGHNGKFTLGLIFINIVFICILGFGKSEYIGVQPLRNSKTPETGYSETQDQ